MGRVLRPPLTSSSGKGKEKEGPDDAVALLFRRPGGHTTPLQEVSTEVSSTCRRYMALSSPWRESASWHAWVQGGSSALRVLLRPSSAAAVAVSAAVHRISKRAASHCDWLAEGCVNEPRDGRNGCRVALESRRTRPIHPTAGPVARIHKLCRFLLLCLKRAPGHMVLVFVNAAAIQVLVLSGRFSLARQSRYFRDNPVKEGHAR